MRARHEERPQAITKPEGAPSDYSQPAQAESFPPRVAGGPDGCDLDRARLLALSDERDQQIELRHGYFRWGWREGWAHGWREGYEAACAQEADAWRLIAGRMARLATIPTFAELEQRRWTVHGEQRTRETFGLPHPADRLAARPRTGGTP